MRGNSPEPHEQVNALVIGAWVSIFWLVVVVVGFACWGKWGELQQADKLGSLLQGVFAPLAFGWLVIAVLLQTRELALQRRVLCLNRDALGLQTEEFKKSVEQFTAQTEIFRRQIDSQQKSDREQILKKRIDYIARRMARIANSCIFRLKNSEPRFPLPREPAQLAWVREGNFDEYIVQAASSLEHFNKNIAKGDAKMTRDANFPLHDINEIVEAVRRILDEAKGGEHEAVNERIAAIRLEAVLLEIDKMTKISQTNV